MQCLASVRLAARQLLTSRIQHVRHFKGVRLHPTSKRPGFLQRHRLVAPRDELVLEIRARAEKRRALYPPSKPPGASSGRAGHRERHGPEARRDNEFPGFLRLDAQQLNRRAGLRLPDCRLDGLLRPRCKADNADEQAGRARVGEEIHAHGIENATDGISASSAIQTKRIGFRGVRRVCNRREIPVTERRQPFELAVSRAEESAPDKESGRLNQLQIRMLRLRAFNAHKGSVIRLVRSRLEARYDKGHRIGTNTQLARRQLILRHYNAHTADAMSRMAVRMQARRVVGSHAMHKETKITRPRLRLSFFNAHGEGAEARLSRRRQQWQLAQAKRDESDDLENAMKGVIVGPPKAKAPPPSRPRAVMPPSRHRLNPDERGRARLSPDRRRWAAMMRSRLRPAGSVLSRL